MADKAYYLNKIMRGCDWCWNTGLPEHFVVDHPAGSVLGKALYGDYLCVYQGVTVGANFKEGACVWPKVGSRVTLYANATVLGSCSIGDNVVIGANAFLLNVDIPRNSMVYGIYPDHHMARVSEEEISEKAARIWG